MGPFVAAFRRSVYAIFNDLSGRFVRMLPVSLWSAEKHCRATLSEVISAVEMIRWRPAAGDQIRS